MARGLFLRLPPNSSQRATVTKCLATPGRLYCYVWPLILLIAPGGTAPLLSLSFLFNPCF